jgi:hypothetical protein
VLGLPSRREWLGARSKRVVLGVSTRRYARSPEPLLHAMVTRTAQKSAVSE